MLKIVFDIDEEGNLHGLYTDEIDLFAVGQVVDIHKASNIEFNQKEQIWEVLSLDGKVLHQNKNRKSAIDWEIETFSPGGEYYDPIISKTE